ncbi:response regulator transcription factor [Fusibacter paucivorans]|uniref:Stage 0 sporulation protein A homolog n=2 Tax=Fusibacter paucivorans TaxID=76009 RepID=A0ABS5PTX6_9FIRM|nr:response regulator transcription factor [Fusibacter paucivorans]MBS7528630.1 response regulator transcription factor [Fusibacter paucivorans]
MNETILLCDDDLEIVQSASIFLEQEGYEVIKAYDGKTALTIAKTRELQLMILDIMMPELDGLSLTRALRAFTNAPIMLVTAKSEDVDKIIGLNFGADDYLTKPYNPLELVARSKALIRRYTMLGAAEMKPSLYRSGGLTFDLEMNTVSVNGDPVMLTATEMRILKLLMAHKGRVFSIREIYENVWQAEAFSPENTVAVHIRRIREKIEIDPKNPEYLKVVWGIGYKIEDIKTQR